MRFGARIKYFSVIFEHNNILLITAVFQQGIVCLQAWEIREPIKCLYSLLLCPSMSDTIFNIRVLCPHHKSILESNRYLAVQTRFLQIRLIANQVNLMWCISITKHEIRLFRKYRSFGNWCSTSILQLDYSLLYILYHSLPYYIFQEKPGDKTEWGWYKK